MKKTAKPDDLAKEIEQKETELRELADSHAKMVERYQQITTEFQQQVAKNQADYRHKEGYLAALKDRQK